MPGGELHGPFQPGYGVGIERAESLTKIGVSCLAIGGDAEAVLQAAAAAKGKIGAGGAGFILFYCPKENQDEFRDRMGNIQELNFGFDNYGSKIIYVGEKVRTWKETK